MPDTEAQTRKRLEAIARDLETDADQLGAIGLEGETSQVNRVEQRMCDLAGQLAPGVHELARKVRRAVGQR